MRGRLRSARAALARGLAVVAALQLAGAPALAQGVESEMNGFFDAAGGAANVTGPTAYSGQSAGYYSGGGLWTRFPSKTVTPFNLKLPSARAGCGGIDLFAGSFSFINTDEIVAMLKATANNAIGFAFQLAIDSISAEIGGVMKDMAHRAQAINQFNMNSCEQAQAAIGALWPKMDGASSTICQQVGIGEGVFSDAARARHGCTNAGERNATLAGGKPGTELVANRNYTWHALMSKSATKPGVEYAEFLMSMVGTVIYVRSDGDSGKLGEFRFIAPASWDTYTALLDGTAAAPTRILKCDTTDELGCLNPGAQTLSISEAASFRARIRRMMASMAAKVRSNAALTGEEISLLGMSSIPLYKILVVNEAAAFRLADGDMNALAEIVAVDVLLAQIDRMLDHVARAQAGTQFVSSEEFRAWRDQVASVKTELARKSTAMAANLSNTYRIIERTQMLEATLKNAMSPQLSASLRFGRGLSAQGLR
jgi:conjugative transfer pilus assembly protein TraH